MKKSFGKKILKNRNNRRPYLRGGKEGSDKAKAAPDAKGNPAPNAATEDAAAKAENLIESFDKNRAAPTGVI